MKIVKYLEESDFLIKGVNETIKNQAENKMGGFLGMLLGLIGASVLGNLLTGKGLTTAGEGIIRAAEGTVRVDQDF